MQYSLSSAPYRLTLATSSDALAVDDLRLRAYAGAGYFKLKDTSYLRVETDPSDSQVICAWENHELVATVRLSPARTQAEAEDLLGFKAPRPLALPAAVFSRGAVNPRYQGQGWMPFMLTLGVQLALEQDYACALGAQASGTPHQAAMLRAGWQVQDVGLMSHAALDMKSTAQFLWLDNERFENAVVHGLRKADRLVQHCGGLAPLVRTTELLA